MVWKNVARAIGITLWECKSLIIKSLARPLRAKAVSSFPVPEGSRWALKRVVVRFRILYPRLVSVHERQSNMPPEWRGHKQVDRILVYHDAYNAGPHLESYIVIDGQAYNIGVKRLRPEMIVPIKLNSDGRPTLKTQKYLIDLWRTEVESGGFLAQSTDHLPGEAREQWYNGAHSIGYGAGELRHVLLDSKVDLFKTGTPGSYSLELRDWDLHPDRDMYVFKFRDNGSGSNRERNILSLGLKRARPPALKERLHLTPDIGEESYDKFKRMVGEDGTITIKEDGASFYFDINKKGANFWSPRISKKTGQRINYTGKLRDLRHIKSKIPIRGMGELLFVDDRTGKVLPAHSIGGVLNANSPVPEHLSPKLVLYRLDKVGRKSVVDLPYTENLDLLKSFIKDVNNKHVEPPTSVAWQSALSEALAGEGLVGIPKGAPISQGRKFKPRGETQDGIITSIQFHHGDKGGIAGVVHYIDEHTGRAYKTSSGFTAEQKLEMMKHPAKYVGKCMVLSHYQGHHGRAAKFEHWHSDKGIA